MTSGFADIDEAVRRGVRTGLALAAAFVLAALPAEAASPASGTVSDGSRQVSWTGGPKLPTASADCGGPSNASCDNFKLTIVPPSYPFQVEITLTPQTLDDYDLQVWQPDGTLAGDSGNNPGAPEQVVVVQPAAGTYTVSAAPFAATRSYTATATLVEREETTPPPPPTDPAPTYGIHVPPAGLGVNAGEPTLGVNETTGAVMYIAGLETLEVQFDDCASPGRATWQDVSFLTTSVLTFDPILWTDQELGRTFVSQLLFPTKQSAMAYTDDDGATWTPSQGSGLNCGVDHQSVGGGPFAPGVLQPVTGYQHAVYYCAQDIALAECAVSLDGGLTFGPGVPIYNLLECGGLHGHIKVAPDGTAYVPNVSCGGEQAVVVSKDSGLTWTVRRVPGSTSGNWDPSVATATDGTVYFGFGGADGHPYVAVSNDSGETWSSPVDVGAAHGIQNIAFPAIIAGDPDRAAFAFLGTTAGGGANGDDPTFPAVWHLYVAHTYDGGRSWVTTNATPGDPVQRGTICAGGINCGVTRNLLDFMDATVDAEGRVLVSFADGCLDGCVAGGSNSGSELATIARQKGGKRLYAAFDQPAGAPAAPLAEATLAAGGVRVTWQEPDDRGAAITGYNVYRRDGTAAPVLLASLGAAARSFDDVGTPAEGYRVTAVNSLGEGTACEVAPVAPAPEPPGDACVPPGKQAGTDATGDGLTQALDIEKVSVAEPPTADGSHELVFTIEVNDLQTFVPGNAWMVIWNRPVPDASFDRNFVAMRATGPGQAAFSYGKVSPPNVNQGTDEGAAQGSFSSDGTITIRVPASAVETTAGQTLGALEVRTFVANVSGMPVSQATAADFATASYTSRGNASCQPPNGAPAAADDQASTVENKPVKVGVLTNDSDPDGDPLTVTAIGTPAHGKVTAKPDGTVSYKPNKGFTGTDSFTYTVGDGQGHTATATVSVSVGSR